MLWFLRKTISPSSLCIEISAPYLKLPLRLLWHLVWRQEKEVLLAVRHLAFFPFFLNVVLALNMCASCCQQVLTAWELVLALITYRCFTAALHGHCHLSIYDCTAVECLLAAPSREQTVCLVNPEKICFHFLGELSFASDTTLSNETTNGMLVLVIIYTGRYFRLVVVLIKFSDLACVHPSIMW